MIAILLCGGQGKRMGSSLPKPLVGFAGKPMVVHLLDTLRKVTLGGPVHIFIVIHPSRQPLFEASLGNTGYEFVYQEEPLGTGHAFQLAWEHLCGKRLQEKDLGPVLVLNGDTPLIPSSLLERLCRDPSKNQIVGFMTEEPRGYGRVLVKQDQTLSIIEERDCSDDQKKIQLVNAGMYCFSIQDLLRFKNIHFSTSNAQKEMYLPDLVAQLQEFDNVSVDLLEIEKRDAWKLMGVNTPEELRFLEKKFQEKF